MRKFAMALVAASMMVPAATIPTAPAMARKHYSDDGYYHGKTWKGKDGRSYCRRKNGTTGLLVGGGAGALLGSAVGGTGATIVGAAAGALLGREADKSRGFKCK